MQNLPELEVVRAVSTTVRANLEVIRTARQAATLRDEGVTDDTLGRLEVRFSKFGQWYEIRSVFEGHFMERVMPGAFTKTISDNAGRIRALFNHGFDPSVGQKVLGPIVGMREDSDSPVMEVDLLDTSYNRDLLPGLRRGLYGSSMRMRVKEDNWENNPQRSKHNPEGIPERSILQAAVDEAGPVTFPANPGSSAAMRSGTDAYYEQLRSVDPGRVDEVERSIRSHLPHAAAPERTSDEAATNPPTGPVSDHLEGLSAGERRQRLHPSQKGHTP